MRHLPVALLAVGLGLAALVTSCGGNDDDRGTGAPVSFDQVQTVFTRNGCASCHPGVNPSLDLREGTSYGSLVGTRALEDPDLYRVVAGDPSRSFLYLKIGGYPAIADQPAVGSRMPPDAPISAQDLKLIHDWISQGARGPDGKTSGHDVTAPGPPPARVGDIAAATSSVGQGTVTGTVIDQARRPVAGAYVTLVLQGSQLEGGEEAVRVAETDTRGRFALANAPEGRFLMKAYAPHSICVSRIVALGKGATARADFGLPNRVLPNPVISRPGVAGRRLSLTVGGSDIDPNSVLALNPAAGIAVELHNPRNAAGRWSGAASAATPGRWVFLAADRQCDVSYFRAAEG